MFGQYHILSPCFIIYCPFDLPTYIKTYVYVYIIIHIYNHMYITVYIYISGVTPFFRLSFPMFCSLKKIAGSVGFQVMQANFNKPQDDLMLEITGLQLREVQPVDTSGFCPGSGDWMMEIYGWICSGYRGAGEQLDWTG